MRIMLDTNILISMIFFRSETTRKFAQILEDHRMILCDYVIDELKLVTERKFPNKYKFLEEFLVELPFEMVYTPKQLNLAEFPEVRDIKDTPILATAILEGVDIFVTGDKDFLELDTKEEPIPRIMTMRDFLNEITGFC